MTEFQNGDLVMHHLHLDVVLMVAHLNKHGGALVKVIGHAETEFLRWIYPYECRLIRHATDAEKTLLALDRSDLIKP